MEEAGVVTINADDVGEEYSPNHDEGAVNKPNVERKKTKSPSPAAQNPSPKNMVPCKVYLPNGEIADLTVDVSGSMTL